MRYRPAALLAAAVLVLAACNGSATGTGDDNGLTVGSGTAPATNGRLLVVAGTNVWGNIAAQIGGDVVTVRSMINDPNVDPHEYESSVNDAAAVAHADLVIENGLGYDDFLNRLVSAASSSGRLVLNIGDLVHVSGANPNPHLWYSPDYVVAAARAITAQLTRKLPQDTATFGAHLAAFLAGENQVRGVIDQIKARHAGQKIAYTERVAGYLVAASGLVLGSPAGFAQALESGDDPSPLDTATFDSALRDHTVRVLIYNSQVADSTTSDLMKLAQDSGVPVVGMSETLPAGATSYQAWMTAEAQTLLAALGG